MSSNEGSTLTSRRTILLALVTLLAFALRAQRIEWQPLWWDEGYTAFFATEPLSEMVALTARDIHPPGYYALLHVWLRLLSDSGSASLRFFSILSGVLAIPLIAALSNRLTNGSAIAALSAAFLLAVNPMHIHYSQEVRMYSLAATTAVASSVLLVEWVRGVRAGSGRAGLLIGYGLTSLLLVHTLYYAAILVALQLVWAAWAVRPNRRALRFAVLAGASVIALSLPWLAYAAPKLASYVANKVQSDQDVALGVGEYLARHLSAFAAGQVLPMYSAPLLAIVAVLMALVPLVFPMPRKIETDDFGGRFSLAESVLFAVLTITGALVFGFLVNLRYPFFPTGGERLLLYVLPYVLVLIACSLAVSRLPAIARIALVLPLLAISAFGILAFYTQPRHQNQDYRPIVQTVQQRGAPNDTVLALFPWQVGYWRAYSDRDADGRRYLPQPPPVGQEILVWDDSIAAGVDAALARGVIWFPEPLSLGSTLPVEVEEYLHETALNVENAWQSDATRLTAWTAEPAVPDMTPTALDFGEVQLTGYGVLSHTVPSDNSVLPVELSWRMNDIPSEYQVALTLLDREDHVWAERNYATPGSLDPKSSADGANRIDSIGMQIPVGLPPGSYKLTLSLLDSQSTPVVFRQSQDNLQQRFELADIAVTLPDWTVEPIRVPVDYRAEVRGQDGDMKILGVSGLPDSAHVLAGDDLNLRVALHNVARDIPSQYDLAVALQNEEGNEVAAWRGWPLPDLPTQSWPEGAIVRVPVRVELPAELRRGDYALTASLVEPARGKHLTSVDLGAISVDTRLFTDQTPQMMRVLDEPVQFGTHARLIGYDMVQESSDNGDMLDLRLYWEALQPLRPQHHIFVHVVDKTGRILTQQDGPPVSDGDSAPTGSWRADEIIATQHTVSKPVGAVGINVGLYDPGTGVRLPASAVDVPVGDFAALPIVE